MERTSCHFFFHSEMKKHEDYALCPQKNWFLREWEEWESFTEVVGCNCKKWDPLIIWHFISLHNSAREKSVWPLLGIHTLIIQDFLLFTAAQIGILPPLKGKQIESFWSSVPHFKSVWVGLKWNKICPPLLSNATLLELIEGKSDWRAHYMNSAQTTWNKLLSVKKCSSGTNELSIVPWNTRPSTSL